LDFNFRCSHNGSSDEADETDDCKLLGDNYIIKELNPTEQQLQTSTTDKKKQLLRARN